ncbi:MAG: thiolase family protein, partial [Eubacterium sp.]|nr:thiolase family protein [Eubacterium sp.]
MNPFNQTDPKRFGRSVSIIGVGCTPFKETLNDPDMIGLTEGELFGHAAIMAMKDAGLTAKDVEFYFHGSASPLGSSNYLSPNAQVAEWFGMRGRPSMHHSEACCTGYSAIDVAAMAIASGKYDCVITGCVEFGDAVAIQGKPAYVREHFSFEAFQRSTEWLLDNAYTRHLMSNTGHDDCAGWYAEHAGLSVEQMDKVLCQLAITARRNSARSPLAIDNITYDEVAKEAGFGDVMEYMQSENNPKIGQYQRISGLEHKCDGAAAAVLCATDLVEKYTENTPIEILGIGNAALEYSNPRLEITCTYEAARQVTNITGLKPEEIDLLYANDFVISSQLLAAEASGYIPDKQAWKYVLDGRTAYNGDKPINPNGGRCGFGHAHAA